MANIFLNPQKKNPLCWIRQPFYLSPGGENSPQKKTPGGYISKSFL
jgi:hypothetical protein